MNYIEEIARNYFQDYSYKKTGKSYDWHLLSKSSKNRWIHEVYEMMQYLIRDFEEKLPPINEPIHKINTSWAQGFNQGVKEERVNIRAMLHDYREHLDEEYERHLREDK